MPYNEFAFRKPRRVSILTALQQWEQWQLSVGRSPATVLNTSTYVNSWIRDQRLSGVQPGAISEVVIGQWINSPSSRRKAGSRGVALSAIRCFFRFCAAKNYCSGNPAELVEVNHRSLSHAQRETKVLRVFTEAEIDLLLANGGPFWRPAVAIGRWTGLRLSDIACLDWSSVGQNKLTVWTRKRDKRIEIPVHHPRLVMIMAEIPRTDEQYVFPAERALAIDPRRRPLLSWRFGALCKRLGIEGASFHSTRHTFATERRASGDPVWFISKSLGHSGEAVTHGYIHE